MPRLTRAEREKIILDFVKGKQTPGYEVVERPNGKYLVKEKPIEIEEEDEEEAPEPVPPPKRTRTTMPARTTKQNARQLLQQLSELIDEQEESDEPPEPVFDPSPRMPTAPVNWNRRRLRF